MNFKSFQVQVVNACATARNKFALRNVKVDPASNSFSSHIIIFFHPPLSQAKSRAFLLFVVVGGFSSRLGGLLSRRRAQTNATDEGKN